MQVLLSGPSVHTRGKLTRPFAYLDDKLSVRVGGKIWVHTAVPLPTYIKDIHGALSFVMICKDCDDKVCSLVCRNI